MANATEEAREFVRDALAKGQSRESIEQALLSAGWPPAQAKRALASYAESSFAIPVPRPHTQLSARQAFVYLLLFTVLLVVAVQLGNLLFQMIDIAFPDPGIENEYVAVARQSAIRWAIASLVVAFPLFLFLSRSVGREIHLNPAMRLSGVRRWLTYLALFIAATILMGDLINFIFNLLEGDLPIRFVLKSVTVAVIAGGIFGYYFLGLSREERSTGGE
jgi:hypothetical protein